MKKVVCTAVATFLLSSHALWAIDENAPFEDFLLRWNNTPESGEKAVSQPGVDRQLLRSLLENINAIKESALISRESADKELVKQRDLLNSLDPVPVQEAPPESSEVIEQSAARFFKMSVTVWEKRANPWSV